MLHARLLLKARGIPRCPETLAGALLEAEAQQSVIVGVKSWFEIKKAEARAAAKAKARRRRR